MYFRMNDMKNMNKTTARQKDFEKQNGHFWQELPLPAMWLCNPSAENLQMN